MRTPLLEIRFSMKATVLNRLASDLSEDDPPAAEDVVGGHWEVVQDEETGGIKRIWIEDTVVRTPNTSTVTTATFLSAQSGLSQFDIPCIARGFPEVGFRSTANTESFFDGKYDPFEAISMSYPARYNLTRRQLITNIRRANGTLLWVEEETGLPTVFEVQGVTPTFDPFNRHIDNLTVLKRADIQ